MNRLLTYLGQIVLGLQTAILCYACMIETAFVPPGNAAGFMVALIFIALGNLDRDSIAVPSILGAIMWALILGASI